jgi:uncharacterized protein
MERRLMSGARRAAAALFLLGLVCWPGVQAHLHAGAGAQTPGTPAPPALTGAVNDFANVIDSQSKAAIERLSGSLESATGDVVVVVTVPTLKPFADVREYAVKLFENGGRGIGQKGKDNGILILLAPKERAVWVEVGYGLEQWITDGFAGEVSRGEMRPEFQNGRYGAGLLAGTSRIVSRIAEGRGVTIAGAERPARRRSAPGISLSTIVFFVILLIVLGRMGGGPRRGVRQWGGPGWSGWSSGVGGFGGGWSGGGGGFGGGFGGFGGGHSGGGGGGASW